MLASWILTALAAQGVPDPARDLRLSLVLEAPERCHPWWPIWIEAWAENTSAAAVPIVREMDGSWDGRVEPSLAWSGSVTGSDGRATAIPSFYPSMCGNYDSNWVGGILVVPPGGRVRILRRDLSQLLGAGRERWLAGAAELRLEYAYRARPSRPSQWGPEPSTQELRFGAFAGVAPFRMTSNAVKLELVPPEVGPDEIERGLALEVELEQGGRFLAWEFPRGRARLRNVSARTLRVVSPESGGAVGFSLNGRQDYPDVRSALDTHARPVGSSRVDLQACKLEYSIVSPK